MAGRTAPMAGRTVQIVIGTMQMAGRTSPLVERTAPTGGRTVLMITRMMLMAGLFNKLCHLKIDNALYLPQRIIWTC
ncbi:hypothetical protein [Marinifilum fragile]|uniref:hypothetical protein n=1 Tax=Marinifilum fragile TaxID=570161 RepID=UPI002AA892C4|nr:hypothetical protein [Marinifilum fragile]